MKENKTSQAVTIFLVVPYRLIFTSTICPYLTEHYYDRTLLLIQLKFRK